MKFLFYNCSNCFFEPSGRKVFVLEVILARGRSILRKINSPKILIHDCQDSEKFDFEKFETKNFRKKFGKKIRIKFRKIFRVVTSGVGTNNRDYLFEMLRI